MANFDNLSTQIVQGEMQTLFDDGMVEGYHSDLNRPPEWYWTTPAYMWGPSKRGFWMGRELRMQEIAAGKVANAEQSTIVN